MINDFDFIHSNRFWSVVVIAVVTYLHTKGLVGMSEMLLVNTILGGHVGLRTVDRAFEKAGSKDTK